MSRSGLATDEQLVQLGGPVVALRVLLPAVPDRCGCGSTVGDGPSLVALDPQDAAVPHAQRAAVGRVAPGSAVADTAWAFLAGGTVAMAGLDVVVRHVAPLGAGSGPGPVLLSLSDLVASLGRTDPDHLPLMRTLVVVGGAGTGPAPPGWEAEQVAGDGVPVTVGLDACHDRATAVPA